MFAFDPPLGHTPANRPPSTGRAARHRLVKKFPLTHKTNTPVHARPSEGGDSCQVQELKKRDPQFTHGQKATPPVHSPVDEFGPVQTHPKPRPPVHARRSEPSRTGPAVSSRPAPAHTSNHQVLPSKPRPPVHTRRKDKSRNKGLASADRSNKATLPLTAPRSIQVVCKRFTPAHIQFHEGGRDGISAATPCPSMVHSRSLFRRN
jgi:hypothetical protein